RERLGDRAVVGGELGVVGIVGGLLDERVGPGALAGTAGEGTIGGKVSRVDHAVERQPAGAGAEVLGEGQRVPVAVGVGLPVGAVGAVHLEVPGVGAALIEIDGGDDLVQAAG